jgi:hypothetical protein
MPRDNRLARVHQGDARHPSPPQSLAILGERATVAPRGWLHMIPPTSTIRMEKINCCSIESFPAEFCERE